LLIQVPYNTELATNDFHIFGPLMKDFEGKLFQQVDELKAKVHWWIDANAKP
jgi:hypothetical protein